MYTLCTERCNIILFTKNNKMISKNVDLHCSSRRFHQKSPCSKGSSIHRHEGSLKTYTHTLQCSQWIIARLYASICAFFLRSLRAEFELLPYSLAVLGELYRPGYVSDVFATNVPIRCNRTRSGVVRGVVQCMFFRCLTSACSSTTQVPKSVCIRSRLIPNYI